MAGIWDQARQAARAAGEAWQHYTNESYWYMALGRALRDSGLPSYVMRWLSTRKPKRPDVQHWSPSSVRRKLPPGHTKAG